MKCGAAQLIRQCLALTVALCCLCLALPVAATGGVGPAAPDFTLRDLQDHPHSLNGLRANGHVLPIFWTTHCVYCHALLPALKLAQTRCGPRRLSIVGSNTGGEHREEVAAYVKDCEVNYLTLAERARNLDVAHAYGIMGTLALVLVSPAGRILYKGHKLPVLHRWLPATAGDGQA